MIFSANETVNILTSYSDSELFLEVSIHEHRLTLNLFKSVKFFGALRKYKHL
jgi:hypothetical protein